MRLSKILPMGNSEVTSFPQLY